MAKNAASFVLFLECLPWFFHSSGRLGDSSSEQWLSRASSMERYVSLKLCEGTLNLCGVSKDDGVVGDMNVWFLLMQLMSLLMPGQ